MEIKELFDIIHKTMLPTLQANNFEGVFPDGQQKEQPPLLVEGSLHRLSYQNKEVAVMVQWEEETHKITLNMAGVADAKDNVYGEVSQWQFDPSAHDERDAKSIANDFEDTLRERFGNGQIQNVKMPESIPRSAVKNSNMEYDAKTLATRLATIYPELKDTVKQNVVQYGDFLPEEFFSKSAAPKVIETIGSGNKTAIKKLFNCLNEIYEDGNNEVQGIVAVTLLGGMKNDPKMLETAKEFMADSLVNPVLSVNQLLYGRGGGKLRKQLENPPAYKEKKKRITFVN